MTPVIHCSAGNIHFFPRTAFFRRKEIQLSENNASRNYTRLTSPSQRLLLPRPSLCLIFLSKHGSRSQSIAAVGADVTTIEEPNHTVSDEDTNTTSSVETEESAPPTDPVATSTSTTRRSRPPRKSEMPPVKNEDLIPGASFTGKVRSIQPFGAFVDFGAFTDGLVHVSRMSDAYVKDVGLLVSVGQEVKVKIVEANMENERISLTMRENDDAPKMKQRRESPAGESSDRPRPVRRNAPRSTQKREEQKSSKLQKGQILTGTVKNTIRSGSFVSLPEGEEGFIPVSEESEGYGNVLGSSSLHVGQEVNVRVLRISRGKVTLTMKKEEDVEQLNRQLNKGVWHAAINPFELAFRKNKDIASFLDEQEKAKESSAEIKDEVDDTLVADDSTTPKEVVEETASSESESVDTVAETVEEAINGSKALVSQNIESVTTLATNEDSIKDEVKEEDTAAVSAEVKEEEAVPVTDEVKETDVENPIVSEAPVNEVVPAKDEVKETDVENPIVSEAPVGEVVPVTDEVKETYVENPIVSEAPIDEVVPVTDEVKETDVENPIVSEDEASSESLVSKENVDSAEPVTAEAPVGEIGEPVIPDSAEPVAAEATVEEISEPVSPESSNGQTAAPEQLSAAKATISPALVKQLREETGAGMMDCKKALSETGGDLIKAQEFLRKKGLASADKKASRATAEGRIGSYIHDSRIGVLIEVNCETDFVSRGEIFRQLVDDLAMQVAACPQVKYLVTEDVPEEFVNKEREIEMQKEDLLSKPENIREKIVDGRIKKRLEEFALLEQPYIKNDKVAIKDYLKQTIATIGENIKVNRFVRYNLGEGLEKKSQDFAAEVAAQTAVKESPETEKDKPVEAVEAVEKAPAVAVSAALVKQLRDETGAGMMDCKKALSETGGDLEKAQEYLRKKGLSSADKKSSRLAAEGRISSYIHDARIGCLIEVNSETDFVARNETFKELVDDLAMQVVACPLVEFVSVEDIPKELVNKEKAIEMEKEDLKSKPENIREKIVEGRISKRLGELALLEQPFIKDDKVMVKDLVKQTVAALGENIKVRRFVRFTLGEKKD